MAQQNKAAILLFVAVPINTLSSMNPIHFYMDLYKETISDSSYSIKKLFYLAVSTGKRHTGTQALTSTYQVSEFLKGGRRKSLYLLMLLLLIAYDELVMVSSPVIHFKTELSHKETGYHSSV